MEEFLTSFSNISVYLSISIQICVVFTLFLVVNYLKNKILNTAQEKLSKTTSIWDDAVVSAAIIPTSVMIWLLFASYVFKIFAKSYPDQIILIDADLYIKTIGVIVVFAWFLIKLISSIEANYFKGIDQDTTLDNASSYLFGKILRVIVFAIAAMIILQSLGYSLTALITLVGAGSFGLTFAAKDVIANFFGGLMVYLDKPFKVGDWIKADSQKLEGTVERIGWRSTRIRNFDKRPVYVPNNLWVTAPVENATRMINRRIKEFIGVRYKDADKLQYIIKDIEQELQNHPDVDKRQNIIVRFGEFGPSSLNFMLYVFTKTTKLKDFLAVKEDIFFKVIEIVHKHGADFAFPTTTLDLPEGFSAKQLEKNK